MTEFPVPYVLTNCHNTLCAVGGTINEDDHVFGLSAAKKYGGIFVPPGMTEFPVPYVLTNCHNTLCAVGGTINEDDHVFGLSAAKKYGGIFVPPHIAVIPVPYVLTNCHNTLCAVGGTINEDDHVFGLSAAKKYGGIFVPPHIAVIHQYMREMQAGCGKMILGTDSHTRYGALGTMAIGEGGGELVKQLLRDTYDVAYPRVVAVSHTRYGALGTMAIGEGGGELVKQLLRDTYDVAYPRVVAVYLEGAPAPARAAASWSSSCCATPTMWPIPAWWQCISRVLPRPAWARRTSRWQSSARCSIAAMCRTRSWSSSAPAWRACRPITATAWMS